MQLTKKQRQVALMGAVAMGALAASRAWRTRRAYDFSGKSVVITGGSRGLGLVMARQLAAEGARITLIARNEEELERAENDIRAQHPSADVLSVIADVRKRYDCERATAQAFERFGSIDVLINNAGIIQVGPIDHMQLSDFEDAMNTHFWGPLYMVWASLPHMRSQGAGRIVNITSIGARIAVPHLVPYSASKFALAGLSDGLRYELAKENIIVTSVFPGLMRTGSPVNAMFKGRRPQEYAWFAISDSLPLASIDDRRAASQIIDACRYGRAELIITMQATLAILARTASPEIFANIMEFMNNLLPGPAQGDGNEARPGSESESRWAGPDQPLTATTYKAAERNNEI